MNVIVTKAVILVCGCTKVVMLNLHIVLDCSLLFHFHSNMALDPSKVRPVPMQKTLLLVNNFIINSGTFLTEFAGKLILILLFFSFFFVPNT